MKTKKCQPFYDLWTELYLAREIRRLHLSPDESIRKDFRVLSNPPVIHLDTLSLENKFEITDNPEVEVW